jgi:hypothetical protein
LYGCQTWSLTFREEYGLRVFENRVLRKIFAPKRDEVTGECKRLLKEELHDLCSSPNVIQAMKLRRMRWAGHETDVGKRRGAYRVLAGNTRERNHLEDTGRIMLKWNFRRGVDWIDLAQDRDR